MVDVAGIHWQVAQATSLKNIAFYQSTSTSKKHMGICEFHCAWRGDGRRESF